MPQATCGFAIHLVSAEKGSAGSSPCCRSHADQSIVPPSSRAGVPVFSRPMGSWSWRSRSDNRSAAASPTRPPGVRSPPTWMTPRRNVPVVRTTDPARIRKPPASSTPATEPDSTIRSTTSPSTTARFSRRASRSCTARRYNLRSACARGPRTAGPFDRLRTLKWMPARSIAQPMMPSSASISRTKCPLPKPPIAGLQDMTPTLSQRWVTSATCAPSRAAAAAASVPACPPPTTITSKDNPPASRPCFT